VVSCGIYLVGSFVEESLIVFSSYRWEVLTSALLVLLTAVSGCVDPQAQKVRCDSDLRPINSSNVEKSVSSAPENRRP
jgi:hypothetical protein